MPTPLPNVPPAPPAPSASSASSASSATAWRLLWAVPVLALAAAAIWLGVQTHRGLNETRAQVEADAARAEARLRTVPLLTDAETALLRRSLNARHVALAESLGLSDSLGRTALVPVDTLRAVRALDGGYSDPLLTPAGAAALALVGDSLTAATRRAGVPAVRPVATSLLRSAESQAALRLVNGNAAAGTSSHEFGTTFDLSYRRFEAVPLPVRVAGRVPRVSRMLVRATAERHAAEASERLTADYPSRYAALLGRVLIGLEDAGAVVALREVRQPVYHVTAAR